MSSRLHAEASAADKLGFIVAALGVLLEAVYVALRYPFTSAPGPQPTLAREVTRVILRACHDLDRFTVAQLRWVFPPSASAYESWLAANADAEGLPAQVFSETIGDEGARLHWIGNRNARKILLYYHGGGYVLPLSQFHFEFTNYLRREVKRRSRTDVKIAFLDYTFVPKHTYPSQFRQAALALQHILDAGASPADILICGDSVGGSLALQVLSHLLHPHPSVPPLQKPARVPFAGILALSPWVIYESSAPSYRQKRHDILQPNTLAILADAMRSGRAPPPPHHHHHGGKEACEPDAFWSEPLVAPPSWWRATAQATAHVLLVYGARELFTEDNAALADKMRADVAGTRAVIGALEEPEGIHIGPVIDATLGRTPSDTSVAISEWVDARLAS